MNLLPPLCPSGCHYTSSGKGEPGFHPVSFLTSSLSLLGKGICPIAPMRGIHAELAQGVPEAWGPGKLLRLTLVGKWGAP